MKIEPNSTENLVRFTINLHHKTLYFEQGKVPQCGTSNIPQKWPK